MAAVVLDEEPIAFKGTRNGALSNKRVAQALFVLWDVVREGTWCCLTRGSL